MALPRAAIFGCAGLDLTADERAFFRDANPLGFILFARNIDTPERALRLTEELRSCVARADAMVDTMITAGLPRTISAAKTGKRS